MSAIQELFSLKKGDNFMLGPYHYVCMGWENGRIRAMTHEVHRGFFMYSLSPEVVLSPGFQILRQEVKDEPGQH